MNFDRISAKGSILAIPHYNQYSLKLIHTDILSFLMQRSKFYEMFLEKTAGEYQHKILGGFYRVFEIIKAIQPIETLS